MVKKIAVVFYVKNKIDNVVKCIDILKRQNGSDITIYILAEENVSLAVLEKHKVVEKSFSKIEVTRGVWNYECEAYYTGILQVITNNLDYVWLLDDNMLIAENALEILLRCEEQLQGEYGFLSNAVLYQNELYYKKAPDIREQNVWNGFKAFETSMFPICYASFGGLFVPVSVIKKIGLPINQMRMGYDGYEFTHRISIQYNGYYVVDSIIDIHTDDNIGFELYHEKEDLISNYRYVYRNDFYLSQREGMKYIGFYFFRSFCQIANILKKAPNKKMWRIMEIIIGTVLGICFRPHIEQLEGIYNE